MVAISVPSFRLLTPGVRANETSTPLQKAQTLQHNLRAFSIGLEGICRTTKNDAICFEAETARIMLQPIAHKADEHVFEVKSQFYLEKFKLALETLFIVGLSYAVYQDSRSLATLSGVTTLAIGSLLYVDHLLSRSSRQLNADYNHLHSTALLVLQSHANFPEMPRSDLFKF